MYSVKEIFYTLQGEGAQSGRAAVFLRFSGCNLWSGREEDRSGAVCRFCDTDFAGTDGPGGGKFATAAAVADAVAHAWPFRGPRASAALPVAEGVRPLAVCTGGEPLLQLDAALIKALHGRGFDIAVETNGTIAAPDGIDWICVSPKAGTSLRQASGNELKFIYPQDDATPEQFAALDFEHFFIQPMDGPDHAANLERAAAYCRDHPRWRLSLQMHKIAGFP